MSKISAALNRMSQSVRWAFNWKDWSPSEKEFARAIACVQSEEKQRLGRFVFRKDARASLAGRLLLRKFISEFASVPYNEIQFDRDEHGKPILRNDVRTVSFNVSHQGDYTVLAGEVRACKLGVDIMKLEYTGGKSVNEFFRIMNRNFSAAEWREIRGGLSSEAEQLAMFFRYWTLKESYVKALGVGIVIDLQSIDFKTNSALDEGNITTDTVLYINGTKQHWLFEETMLDSKHCVAVALQENGKASESNRKTFDIINPSELLGNVIPLYPEDMSYVQKYFEKPEHPFG